MNRLQDCFDDEGAGEEIGEGQLFQGMRFDPKHSHLFERTRAFDPTLKAWANHEPMGYVEGLNVYAAPVDDPVNPVNPLGT